MLHSVSGGLQPPRPPSHRPQRESLQSGERSGKETLGKKMGKSRVPGCSPGHVVSAQSITDCLDISSVGLLSQWIHRIYYFHLVTANLNTAKTGQILLQKMPLHHERISLEDT